jgi:hypothetical protein
MVRVSLLAALTLGVSLQAVSADDVYRMCKDNTCQNCSVAIKNAGTGYPNCVTYDSETVFFNQDIPGSEGG